MKRVRVWVLILLMLLSLSGAAVVAQSGGGGGGGWPGGGEGCDEATFVDCIAWILFGVGSEDACIICGL